MMRKSTVLLKMAFASGFRILMTITNGKEFGDHSFLSSQDHLLTTHLEMIQV